MNGTIAQAGPATPSTDVAAPRGPAPALFALAVFTSAALVFIVEPMLARLILPKLGGSSAVWNTCLAFFQAALLLGYAYAHALQRIASIKRQMIVHLGMLALAALALPLHITGLLGDPAVDRPALWLIAVLTISVGAPFAALSATAPLIQAWYARLHADGETARDPYVLYAASNLGSLLALLAYPLLVEPFARLGAQSLGWTAGYAAFAGLIAVVALAARRAPAAPASDPDAAAPATWRQRLTWLVLAAAPSSLLLGVTGHITADVASAPFLWVIPLALYLITFIVAFRLPPGGAFDNVALLLQVLFLPEALLMFSVAGLSPLVELPVDLLAFYFTAQVGAFALARRRPDKTRLTEFYLWMSIGGVLGGAFNAFVAPVIFNGVWEYPIVLVLSALARPNAPGRMSYFERGCLGAGLVCCALLLVLPAARHLPAELSQVLKMALMFAPAICVIVLRGRALPVTGILAALAVASIMPTLVIEKAESHRSFFGVIQVKTKRASGGVYRVMVHGSTIHGTEHLGADRCTPTTYYTPRTPMGQVFRTEQARRAGMTIGTVGLGSGSVATYVRASDHLTFFEIDPAVKKIALDPARFLYVRGCARGPVDVTMGDARLSLEKTPSATFDLLMIDAFSSDSVPTHLMTEQAMRTYLRVLKPGGLVMLHLSNRNLDLGGVAEASMRHSGGYTLQQIYWSDDKDVYRETSSHVLIAAPDPATLQPYVATGRWTYAPPPARAWTDDYINVVGAMWSHIRHG